MSKSVWVTAMSIAILGTVSCASVANRKIASDPSINSLFQNGMLPAAQDILKTVSASDFPDHCVAYLSNLEAQLEEVKPSDAPQGEVVAHSGDIINTLWLSRLKLHQRLPEFSKECVLEVRNTSRLFRLIEDFLGEHSERLLDKQFRDLDADKLDYAKEPTPVLENPSFYLTQYNPDIASTPGLFKNGDIMLARGPSVKSALISRVADNPTQFSHLILIHVDPKTKAVETMESYIGVGASIYDEVTALKNENVRFLLLRAKDQALASRAADLMYEKIKATQAAGKLIPYDYKLDFKDHSEVSCAEIGSWAYELASDGKVLLPAYPSSIVASADFLDHLGLKPGVTFEPGDMEVDPRFDVVMEWRDLRLTRDSRTKDAILSAMLDWANTKGYKLRTTLGSALAKDVVWPLSRTPLWSKLYGLLKQDKNLGEVPVKMVNTLYLTMSVADPLHEELRNLDESFEKTSGWAMTYPDLYKALEQIRVDDIDTFMNIQTRGQSKIHMAFRPDDIPWEDPRLNQDSPN